MKGHFIMRRASLGLVQGFHQRLSSMRRKELVSRGVSDFG
jgi:hypothetical protein